MTGERKMLSFGLGLQGRTAATALWWWNDFFRAPSVRDLLQAGVLQCAVTILKWPYMTSTGAWCQQIFTALSDFTF